MKRRGINMISIISNTDRLPKMAKQIALLTLISTSAGAQSNTIETKNLRLVSSNFGHAYILPHAASCFQNALDFHQKLFDYSPSGKITVELRDDGDFGNGGATAIPKNAIFIGMAPFSYAFETSPAGERMFSMMIQHQQTGFINRYFLVR
jgi:hypothetical protein